MYKLSRGRPFCCLKPSPLFTNLIHPLTLNIRDFHRHFILYDTMTTKKPPTSMSMPSAADKSPPKPNNTSPPLKGSEDPVDSFFSFVEEYCAGDEFKRLKEMCQENTRLKKKLNDLQIAYNQNIDALTRSGNKWQSEHDKLNDVCRAKDDAIKQLKDERQASQALKDQVRNMEEHVKTVTATSKNWESRAIDLDNKEKAKATRLEHAQKEKERLEEELKSIQEQLESKTTELGQVQDKFKVIRSFVVELENLAEKEAEMYVPTAESLLLFRHDPGLIIDITMQPDLVGQFLRPCSQTHGDFLVQQPR